METSSNQIIINFNPTYKQDKAWKILNNNKTNILYYGGAAVKGKIYKYNNITISMRWHTIDGFGNYIITENGNVINNRTGKKLKFDYSGKSKKYKRVTLSCCGITKRFLIHRLVAEYFISNPNNKPQVNHIDGNAKNNKISNLEWCTQSENMKHAFRLGLQKPQRNCPKLKESDIVDIFKMRKEGLYQRQIAEKFGVSREHVRDILNGKRWKR